MLDRSSHAGITTLALERRPLNILNGELMGHLTHTLEDLSQDPETRVVTLTSKVEGVFSAGADVREHLPGADREMIGRFVTLCDRIVTYPKATIAVVNGKCLGGGMELALSCDFVIASDASTFGQPEIAVGVFPPVGASLYPRVSGLKAAYRMNLDPRPITAAEALRMGFVTAVVPPGEVDAAANELAATLAKSSLAVYQRAKRAILEGLALPWAQSMDRASRIYLEDLMATEDAAEGLHAFLEKRSPRWKDR